MGSKKGVIEMTFSFIVRQLYVSLAAALITSLLFVSADLAADRLRLNSSEERQGHE